MIVGECTIGNDIDGHAKQLFGRDGELSNLEQTDVRRTSDEKIEIAARVVRALPDGSEHTKIGQAEFRSQFPEFVAMQLKSVMRQRAHRRSQSGGHCLRRVPPPGFVRSDVGLRDATARGEL